ncbi:hypothetical protein FQA39_LY17600 [Lamprigera yunnana]|nr:hypothetical protein FQA39_LY17600 [Lamprigera yunnana]
MEHVWFEDDGMDQNLIMHFAEKLAQPLPLEILEENPNIIARNEDYFEITVPQYSNELFKQHSRMSRATFEDLREVILNHMNNKGNRPARIELSKKVLLMLYILSKQVSFFDADDKFGVSRVDAGDSDSFAREGDDRLLMTFKRFSFTVDTKRGVDTELEIGRQSDGEQDATDGELNPEALFEGLAQEETVWPKFIVESSLNNFKNSA